MAKAGDVTGVPIIDVDPLFGDAAEQRHAADMAIGRACEEIGFFVAAGRVPARFCRPERMASLFRFFMLPEATRRKLARKRYVAGNPNRYRGYFPTTDGEVTFKEGIDIGPEFAEGDPRYPLAHPLIERNAWPDEALLPGWRAAVAGYWDDMLGLGTRIMHAVARYLGVDEAWFDAHFAATNSTLRLLRYPVRTARSLEGVSDRAFVEHRGERRFVVAAEHVDSGILTLLHQDGVGGLQVRRGEWVDVPPLAGSMVVNIGGALQRWSNDRFVATPHRVLGSGEARCSLPFFFEPSVDAVLAPVPGTGAPRYAPIAYGTYLIAAMQRFLETRGVATPQHIEGATM
ncbi:MAG TPA: 2OG-Fe(II) oxygenase family protein [Stellaceae bacterium]|nr:2OG-Fe(II) oxygenase family protein [Stellaceae bacterium]